MGIESAADAARALEPLAGRFAGVLFGVGLVGAALLAAAVLPLSTACSVCEFTGHEGALDDGFRGAPLFYGTFVLVAGAASAGVLLPGVPLVPLLVLSQVLNAVLLLPLLVLMYLLSRDDEVTGGQPGTGTGPVHLLAIGFIAVCVVALLVLEIR